MVLSGTYPISTLKAIHGCTYYQDHPSYMHSTNICEASTRWNVEFDNARKVGHGTCPQEA